MIIDTLDNLKNYTSVHSGFATVADFIANNTLENLAEGKYDLGNGVRAGVNIYNTKKPEETFIECHKKYIDIQVLGFGSEKIGYVPVAHCTTKSYDEKKDFQVIEGIIDPVLIDKDMFAIFFPQDGHMPGLHNGDMCEVKKIVFKIPV